MRTRDYFCSLRRTLLCIFFGLLASHGTAQDPSGEKLAPEPDLAMTLKYPASRAIDHADEYFGTRIPDPFRWLEDVDSEETKEWVTAQNELTQSYLGSIAMREPLRQRLTALWNFERYGTPQRHGELYFFTYNNGLQNQNILYTAKAIDGDRVVLLDPNELQNDGTVALSGWVPSKDGKYLAYGLAASGSDWNTWKVRDVTTGLDLSDKVEWVKFSSVAWTHDGRGFFYSRYDEPTEGQFTGVNYFQKLYFHRLGTSQDQDQLVYDRPDEKEWGFRGAVSDDGAYLIITVWRGSERKNQIFIAPLSGDKLPERSSVIELMTGFRADYLYLGNDGDTFYFETDDGAPRRRVIAVQLQNPKREGWRDIVPEAIETIEHASLIGNRFLVTYLQDAASIVRQVGIDGKRLPDIDVPALGTVAGFDGKRSSEETFFSFTNYVTPASVYRFSLSDNQVTLWKRPELAFDPNDFTTERIFYRSHDGTRVPMILSYKRGLEKNGQCPTILYGYGGFNISVTPNFSPAHLAWMERGGIYAVANLRGGGEYGREWHESGMKARKQNVFNDFIAAAEHLIEEKYTDPSKLAISGRSNGGLLVGAVMAQRPDLFAVALPAVGVMDMLRFHRFTIGWAWVGEFGSSDDPDQFQTLLKYSPLHCLRPGTRYPATLVTTADHDDRVVPGHSFKFAARLQQCQSGTRPTLIRIETSAGHGAGTPVSKLIDTAADTLAFVWHNMGLE